MVPVRAQVPGNEHVPARPGIPRFPEKLQECPRGDVRFEVGDVLHEPAQAARSELELHRLVLERLAKRDG